MLCCFWDLCSQHVEIVVLMFVNIAICQRRLVEVRESGIDEI